MSDIQKQINEIEMLEAQIKSEEQKIVSLEDNLLDQLNRQPRMTMFAGPKSKRLKYFHAIVLRKLTRVKFFYSFLVVTGIVLVWRGIWELADRLPIIKVPAVSIVVGLVILWLTQRSPDGGES